MAENYEIFRGNSSADPQEIRDALGWMETSGEEAVSQLMGAVMTLCNRVAKLEAEVSDLRSLVTPVTR